MLGGVGKPNKIITRIKSVFIRDQFPFTKKNFGFSISLLVVVL